MIISLTIENYLSIKGKVTLSLEASASKKLPNNLIPLSKNEQLLKSAIIYGPNASGKSNIIKAIFFIWRIVKHSHAFNMDTKIVRVPFKLDKKCLNKPSKFEILFIQNGIKYRYGFSCTNDEIIEEYLYYWPKGRIAQIFSRKNTQEFEFNTDTKQQEAIRAQMSDNVLYLSRATAFNYGKIKEAYEFFANYLVINYGPQWQEYTINQIHENKELRNKVINVMQKADFGGITDLITTKKKEKIQGFEFKIDKERTSINPIKEEEKELLDIKFIHQTKDGKAIEFSMAEESAGTQKTLSMLGPIFDILKSGKTAFIDELELNLHPNISKFLVKLFNSKLNTSNAQIIFTSHNTNLLDNELFRRDQLYVCSKESNDGTIIRSFLDFDLRETADFEKAYLAGRVGGLPFIDETILG